jgi:hypothetical protein
VRTIGVRVVAGHVGGDDTRYAEQSEESNNPVRIMERSLREVEGKRGPQCTEAREGERPEPRPPT